MVIMIFQISTHKYEIHLTEQVWSSFRQSSLESGRSVIKLVDQSCAEMHGFKDD